MHQPIRAKTLTTHELLELIQTAPREQLELQQVDSVRPHPSIYEAICSLRNASGGYVVLGVNPERKVLGIPHHQLARVLRNLHNKLQQENIFYPPLAIEPQVGEVLGQQVIYLVVPSSSKVQSYKNEIWIREGVVDRKLDYTDKLYGRLHYLKPDAYFTNRVYRELGLQDLDAPILAKVRKYISVNSPDPATEQLDDWEWLRSKGLVLRHWYTQVEGLTLAAILLCGTEYSISSALGGYQHYLQVRLSDPYACDAREVLSCNLLESFTKIMDFCNHYLNNNFVLDDFVSVSARDIILRELVLNWFIHRDYNMEIRANLIITPDAITVDNGRNEYLTAQLLKHQVQGDKRCTNPSLQRIFTEMGWIDKNEARGAGIAKIRKYSLLYSQGEPEVQESRDMFVHRVRLAPINCSLKVGGFS